MATVAASLRRARDTTVLGRLVTAARAQAPGAGRWLRRAGRRARSLTLQASGLGSISWAAWEVAVPLGLLTVGVSLLVLEWLSSPEGG